MAASAFFKWAKGPAGVFSGLSCFCALWLVLSSADALSSSDQLLGVRTPSPPLTITALMLKGPSFVNSRPAANFAIPLAAIQDIRHPADRISGGLTLSLMAYSCAFLRFGKSSP